MVGGGKKNGRVRGIEIVGLVVGFWDHKSILPVTYSLAGLGTTDSSTRGAQVLRGWKKYSL